MTGPHDGRRSADPAARFRSLLARTVAGQLRLASRLSVLAWEPVLDGLAAAARPSGTPEPAAPAPGVVRIEAEPGEDRTIAFAVENRYDHLLDVTFAADPLAVAAGPSAPPDAVSFDPATAVIPPGGHVVVRATVQVTDHFVVGEVYSTALHVCHMSAAPVPVEILVVPGRAR